LPEYYKRVVVVHWILVSTALIEDKTWMNIKAIIFYVKKKKV
jgi:hypothetical protein